jgi:hypothetical protein
MAGLQPYFPPMHTRRQRTLLKLIACAGVALIVLGAVSDHYSSDPLTPWLFGAPGLGLLALANWRY